MTFRWQPLFETPIFWCPGWNREHRAWSPAIPHTGSLDTKLYAVVATTGVRRWEFTTGGGIVSTPAVSPDGSTVVVGSRDRKLYAVSASSGTKIWEFETGGVVESSPAFSPDGTTVYVGSSDTKVYAVLVSTGAKKWQFATGGAVLSSPAVLDHYVYALSTERGGMSDRGTERSTL